jgi:hypothetical protein
VPSIEDHLVEQRDRLLLPVDPDVLDQSGERFVSQFREQFRKRVRPEILRQLFT